MRHTTRLSLCRLVGLLSLALLLVAAAARGDWEAYNDLCPAPGAEPKNITTYGPGQGGPLVNHADGRKLAAVLRVLGRAQARPAFGHPGRQDTEGRRLFASAVDCRGALVLDDAARLELRFENLDPDMSYEVAVYGNRGMTTDYPPAKLEVRLSGAESPASAEPVLIEQGGRNTRRGRVARFQDVRPGNDGRFSLLVRKSPQVKTRDVACVNAVRIRAKNNAAASQ